MKVVQFVNVTVGGGLIIVEEDGEYAWRHLVKCKIRRYVSETELHLLCRD